MKKSIYLYVINNKLYEVYYKYNKNITYRYVKEYGSRDKPIRYYDYGRKKSLGMARVLTKEQAREKFPQYFI